jgi:hypothetical protein
MTATLVAILSLTVLGIPITLAVDRTARSTLLLGQSFLYGSGAIFFILQTLSIARIRWTLIVVTTTALVVFCAAVLLARRQSPSHAKRPPGNPKLHIFDLATLVILAGYAFYVTLAPLGEWDFWAIWGLKAKVFLEIGGIDWRFLESPWNTFAHTDYPLLVPLNYDFAALVGGGWSDRWLGLFCLAWGAALVLVARALAARETSPFFASLLTTALASLAVTGYVGLAEGALIAFGGAGVLFIRSALIDDDATSWRHGALMLGFAANCKNEGVALLAAAIIAVAVVSWRANRARLLSLWPAYALAAPWLLLRALHVLPTDIAGGSALTRFFARLPFARVIFAFLVANLFKPWLWIVILAGLLIASAAARRRERFILLVTAIQIVFYLAAYFATPNELRWHVLTSWPRLTGQISVPITFAVFLMLASSLRRAEDAPPARVDPADDASLRI